MYYTFLHNGDTRLILKPETDVERELFKILFESGPVEFTPVTGNLNVLETNVSEGIMVKRSTIPRKVSAAETETVQQLQ